MSGGEGSGKGVARVAEASGGEAPRVAWWQPGAEGSGCGGCGGGCGEGGIRVGGGGLGGGGEGEGGEGGGGEGGGGEGGGGEGDGGEGGGGEGETAARAAAARAAAVRAAAATAAAARVAAARAAAARAAAGGWRRWRRYTPALQHAPHASLNQKAAPNQEWRSKAGRARLWPPYQLKCRLFSRAPWQNIFFAARRLTFARRRRIKFQWLASPRIFAMRLCHFMRAPAAGGQANACSSSSARAACSQPSIACTTHLLAALAAFQHGCRL